MQNCTNTYVSFLHLGLYNLEYQWESAFNLINQVRFLRIPAGT